MKSIIHEPRHPLVYLLFLIAGVLYSFFPLNEWVLIMGCFLSIIFLILDRRYKLAAIVVMLYVVAAAIQHIGILLQSHQLKNNINIVAALLMDTGYSLKTAIPIICGLTGLIKVPEGQITAFFLTLKLPKSFAIGFCLFLRFLPTIVYEYRMIRSAQKFRSIGISPLYTLVTFPKVFMHVYIPLLMRTMIIGEEISVSMSTRGITLNKAFTPYTNTSFLKRDFILLGYTILSILIIGRVICLK